MRLNTTIALFAGMLLLATGFRAGADSAPAGGPLSKPFQATYEVRRGHLMVANSIFTLQDEGSGTWRYQSVTKPAGLLSLFRDDIITETSHFRLHDGQLRPAAYTYRYQNGSRDRDQSVNFDWRTMVAHTVNEGKKRDLTLAAGMTDRFLAQLALSHDLASGRGPAATYTVVDRGEIKRYNLKKSGTEKVRTPAGTFDTIRVIKSDPDSKRVSTFWCAPKLGYLPVRMQQSEPDEPTISINLEKFKTLAPRELKATTTTGD